MNTSSTAPHCVAQVSRFSKATRHSNPCLAIFFRLNGHFPCRFLYVYQAGYQLWLNGVDEKTIVFKLESKVQQREMCVPKFSIFWGQRDMHFTSRIAACLFMFDHLVGNCTLRVNVSSKIAPQLYIYYIYIYSVFWSISIINSSSIWSYLIFVYQSVLKKTTYIWVPPPISQWLPQPNGPGFPHRWFAFLDVTIHIHEDIHLS